MISSKLILQILLLQLLHTPFGSAFHRLPLYKSPPNFNYVSSFNHPFAFNSAPVFYQTFYNLLSSKEAYCLSPGCVKAAATLINMIDQTQDPCNDFYEFACGNLIKQTTIPDHKIYQGSWSDMEDELNQRLRKLFEAEAEADEPLIFSSVRKLYSSCMDQDLLEEVGRKKVLEIVKKLGGWPVLEEEWSQHTFQWQRLLEKANNLGLALYSGTLLSTYIYASNDDSTKRIIYIDQPSLGLSREYLIKGTNDTGVQAYFRYMVDTAIYLGADEQRAEQELKDALNFELELSEMTLPQEKRRNETALNNLMTIKEASKLFPGYDWLDHINKLLDSEEIKLDENEIINLAVPRYFEALGKYLPTIDDKVIANYMIWRFVQSMMPYTDRKGQNIRLAYKKAILGKETTSPRWEICVDNVAKTHFQKEGSLAIAVGSMYARRYFPSENKDIADEMVRNIKTEFKLMLDELDWMDSKTKIKAHIKVNSMTSFIGYEKEILNNDLLNDFYSDLELDSEHFLENMLNLAKSIKKYYTREFRKTIDKLSWKYNSGAAVVNAFYSPSKNSISFPAGILDGVAFGADRPAYLNFGAIGMVVGHEITHGFDDMGSQRDGEGNLVDWWEKETKEKYIEKAKCIIDQYGNYSVWVKGETINLNGINTQGENIADNGGSSEAIRAYERLIAEKGEELKLPGLPYTQRQLFWLSGAAMECTAVRPDALKYRTLTGFHSPSRFRINGPYRNIEEFSRDWNCPKGSPMNPVKKCRVW